MNEQTRRQCQIPVILLLLSIHICVQFVQADDSKSDVASERPAHWAQPILLEGVPNLHKVSDQFYRSAQPSAEGMRNAKAMGIKTVVNLRSFHSDRDEIASAGLGYEHIYMKAWHPEETEIIRFLQIATDQRQTPLLVHCQHGADRTGTMSAIYRIAIQGWSKQDAIKEMTDGGFGFHEVWVNLIPWITALDIEKLKKEADLDGSRKRTG